MFISAMERPVHSLTLSIHFLCWCQCFLHPGTVPCNTVFVKPFDWVMGPYHCSSCLFTVVNRSLKGLPTSLVCLQTSMFDTQSNAFLKLIKAWKRSFWCCRYFSDNTQRLKICSTVPLPILNPACSSASINSAFDWSLLSSIFSITLLWWDIRLMVLPFLQSCILPFLGIDITIDFVHCSDHILVCHILLHMVVRTVVIWSPPAYSISACMLSTLADFPHLSDCTVFSTSDWKMVPLLSLLSLSIFPYVYNILTFHIPIVNSSCILIINICLASVAFFPPLPWCMAIGVVIVYPGCDWSGMAFCVILFMIFTGESWACVTQWHPSPLQALATASILPLCWSALAMYMWSFTYLFSSSALAIGW